MEKSNDHQDVLTDLTEESLHIKTPYSDMKGLVTFLETQRKKLESCRSMINKCRITTESLNAKN